MVVVVDNDDDDGWWSGGVGESLGFFGGGWVGRKNESRVRFWGMVLGVVRVVEACC